MVEIYKEEIISKYIYNNKEKKNNIFLFELVLKKFDESKKLVLRKIKNYHTGKLIDIKDNIKYKDIKKVIISAIDINNSNKDVNIECLLNHPNKHTLILKNNIFIDFFNSNGFLESNYNIINI